MCVQMIQFDSLKEIEISKNFAKRLDSCRGLIPDAVILKLAAIILPDASSTDR